jgi:xylulokinase
MKPSDAYLGLDIGTSGCKAVLFDLHGQQQTRAYRSYSLSSPAPGWAELDPTEVTDRCFDVIREAAVGSDASIRAIGISSQGEAFTPIDAYGRAVVSVGATGTTSCWDRSD